MAFGDDRTARPRRGERLDHRAHRLGRDPLAAHARREPVTYLIFTAQAAMDADHAVEVEPAGIAHRMDHVAASGFGDQRASIPRTAGRRGGKEGGRKCKTRRHTTPSKKKTCN